MRTFSIGIWNDRPRPHVVWIEPWGEDYTLLPGEKLLITTSDSNDGITPVFNLVETEGNTQVYVERLTYPKLEIDGVAIECGHNRKAAIDAGIFPG